MQLGDLTLPAGAGLAPMAGVSDAAMRAICAGYGAAYTVSEMVSAKALTMGDKKTRGLMAGGGGGAAYGVQLFGCEPAVLREAVLRIDEAAFDFLDLNMGCPAPKIVAGGSGSALLKDPPLAGRMAEAAVAASRRPVSVKLRTGWDDADKQGLEVARRCEAAGVSLLCVHGRTRAHQYKAGVDYAAVAAIKAAVKIPVVFNGDVCDGSSALAALEKTGCDGVMVGRAAMGAPWVFADIRAALLGEAPPPPPGLATRFGDLRRQVEALCEARGEEAGMRAARGVAGAYMRGLKGAASLRRQAFGLTRFGDLDLLIATAYEYQKAAGTPAAGEEL